jgi:ubiquitin thioesterase OTU1
MEPTRRFVDADNSCLFSSIGYLIDNKNFNETTKLQYRQLLANYLEASSNIDAVTLGTNSKEEYIESIQNPSTWGGAIELKLFSEMFQIEIASIDVQSNRVDIFGQDKNYPQRIFVVYNGVHYDPLVMAYTDEPKDDITSFESEDSQTLIDFQNFVKVFKEVGDFVDPKNMNNFECEICNTLFESQMEAYDHANNYQHWNFREI